MRRSSASFAPACIAGAAESLLFDTLLTWCRDRQLVKARGRQRTDSTHILAAVRALNRIEVVGETLRHALNTLAVVAPAWLRAVSPPDWRDRYARRAEDDRLPTTQAARAALTLTIGARWLAVARGRRSPGCPALAARGARRRHPAPGLAAKLLVGRHPAALARGGQHPAGGAVHQLPL